MLDDIMLKVIIPGVIVSSVLLLNAIKMNSALSISC